MLAFFETPVTVIHIICCFFLGLIILIQPGRSGGLGAAFGGAGGTQVFGGRGAGDLLSKVTWVTATIFFITSMLLAYMSSSTTDSLEAPAPEDFTPKELPTLEAPPSLPNAPEGDALGAADTSGTEEAPAEAGEENAAATPEAEAAEATPGAAPTDAEGAAEAPADSPQTGQAGAGN